MDARPPDLKSALQDGLSLKASDGNAFMNSNAWVCGDRRKPGFLALSRRAGFLQRASTPLRFLFGGRPIMSHVHSS